MIETITPSTTTQDATRSSVVPVRLLPAEAQVVKTAAQASSLPVSQFVRQVLLEALTLKGSSNA